MLALTRKKDEAVIINDNIEIKVLAIQGDKVKLGISAPKDVNVYREEVYRSICDNNRAATTQIEFSLEDLQKILKK